MNKRYKKNKRGKLICMILYFKLLSIIMYSYFNNFSLKLLNFKKCG